MTVPAGTVDLNIGYEGLLMTVLLIMMKKFLLSGNLSNLRQNHTQLKTKMVKIDTLFMTKTAETKNPHIRDYPRGGGGGAHKPLFLVSFFAITRSELFSCPFPFLSFGRFTLATFWVSYSFWL